MLGYIMAGIIIGPARPQRGYAAARPTRDVAMIGISRYEWTKMYKAINFQDAPFQYMAVRMWNNETTCNRSSAQPCGQPRLRSRASHKSSSASLRAAAAMHSGEFVHVCTTSGLSPSQVVKYFVCGSMANEHADIMGV